MCEDAEIPRANCFHSDTRSVWPSLVKLQQSIIFVPSNPSQFVFKLPSIFLNHFINLFLVKLIGRCHRSSSSLFVTQIIFSWLAIFASVGPTTLSAYVNTIITIKNLHTLVNFDWRDSFSSQKLNHGTLLKLHRRALSSRFHSAYNSHRILTRD
jgi:hypothetical protein